MNKWRRKWHHFRKTEKMAKDLVSKSKNGEENGIIFSELVSFLKNGFLAKKMTSFFRFKQKNKK